MELRISGENINRLLAEGQKPVLEIKIAYPQILGNLSRVSEYNFNDFYRIQARTVNRNVQTNVFSKAKRDYLTALSDEYDFTLHSYLQTFTVTRLEEQFTSLYIDTYRYNGGLHGITARQGNTWDLKRGVRVTLSYFFRRSSPYRAIALKHILKKIKAQTNCFETASTLAKQRFSERNFYLTGDSIGIFYPTYAIAPFHEGIQTFEIPFSEFKNCWIPQRNPSCIKKYVGLFAQADEERFL